MGLILIGHLTEEAHGDARHFEAPSCIVRTKYNQFKKKKLHSIIEYIECVKKCGEYTHKKVGALDHVQRIIIYFIH